MPASALPPDYTAQVWTILGIAEEDAIPASEAVVLWLAERVTGKAHSVRVLRAPAHIRVLDEPQPPGVFRHWYWMPCDPTRRDRTPEFHFSELIAFYGLDKAEAERAIREFARIRECEWARRMVPLG